MTRPTYASAREFLTSEDFAEKIRTYRKDAAKHLDPTRYEVRVYIEHRLWFSSSLADSWSKLGIAWRFPPTDEAITGEVLIDKIKARVFTELGEDYAGGEIKVTVDGGSSEQHMGAVSAVMRSRESESEREATRAMERLDRELKRHLGFAEFAPGLAKDFAAAFQTMSRGSARIVTAAARMLEALASEETDTDDLLAKFTSLAKLVADDDTAQKVDKADKAGKALGGGKAKRKRRIGPSGRITTEPEPEPETPTTWELTGVTAELTDDQVVELIEQWARANPERAKAEAQRLVKEGVIKLL